MSFPWELSHTLGTTQIEFFSDEDEPEVDLGNITNSYTVPTTLNTRIHRDHPIDNVIGDWKEGHWNKTGLRNKKDERGIVIRNKARLVAHGHRQEEGIDYEDVFATVTNNVDILAVQEANVVATSTTEAEYVAAASSNTSKEVGTPRYLSLVVLLKKVGDEAIHKELGDRMEMAATTASSLEAEQDSGDVDAQTRFEITSKQSNDPPLSRGYTLGSGEDSMKLLELMELCTQLSKFAERHNVVAFLEKPIESDGFVEIIDFLKASSVHYALIVNPIIYTSCIKQFWATAKVQTVNGVRQLQAIVDKKRVIITESSIRCDLHLEDAGGTDCLPTATIFEELARMGYEKPIQKLTFYKAFFSPQWKYFILSITQCLSAKSSAWNEFISTMASLIICLATNQKFNLSKYIFDAMVKHLDGGFLYFDIMMVQASEEVGEDSDHPTDSNQIPIVDQPSTSSQPKQKQKSKRRQRKEAEVAHDETEHEESVPTPSNDPLPSGEDSMKLNDLMVLCTKLQTQVLDLEKAKDAQAKETADLKKRVQRLERKKKSRTTGLRRLKKVGMSRRVESSEDQ
ncbi:hypothetical protein Tco_0103368 [Tanacetum coccineum]